MNEYLLIFLQFLLAYRPSSTTYALFISVSECVIFFYINLVPTTTDERII